MMFRAIGFQDNLCIRGCALGDANAIEVNGRDDLIELARQTARALFA